MSRPLLLLIFSALTSVIAQSETINDFRTEQIYLVTDKTDYNTEDTIHLEGIVTSLAHNHSAPYSRILYVELINPRSNSVTIRQKITCAANGLFRTSILPEPDAEKGDYLLRAYTRLMRNFSTDAFAIRHVTIGVPGVPDDDAIDNDIQCQIIPTGNRMMPDIPQQIIAVLTSHSGHPIASQNLSLVNGEGDTIQQRHTSPSGYAIFNFIPQRNDSYTICFSAMGVNKVFPTPAPDNDACHITGAVSGCRLRFAIEGKVPDPHRILSFDRCNGLSEISTDSYSGITTLKNTPTGPVTLFLTDSNLDIISQISILPKTDFNPDISVADTLKANNSVDLHLTSFHPDSMTVLSRFVPENFPLRASAEYQLAVSDFVSPLPLPVNSLFTPEATTDFQAWLSAATFCRFNLTDAVNSDSPVYQFLPEQNISISGTIYDDINAKHPMKGGRLIAYNSANRLVTDTCVAKNGRFTVDVDDFKDGTEFFLQAINSKEIIIPGIIKLDDATYPAIDRLPLTDKDKTQLASSGSAIDAGVNNKISRNLPNITVKARVIRTEKPNYKKFYGARYVDQESFEKYNSTIVMEALRRLGFIRVVEVKEEEESDMNNPGHVSYQYYMIQSTRIPTTLGAGAGEVPIIFDGTYLETKDAQFIFYMPLTQIESIEHLNPAEALAYSHRNINGAILITSRRLGQPPLKEAKGLRCWPPGLAHISQDSETGLKTPGKPGNYRLVVDIVSHDGNVKSISRRVHVTPSSPARGD